MALNLNSNLVLSGSLEITGSFETSGSSTFNGTFTGDGSSLTGVTGSWDGNFSGSAVMTGSVDVTGSISATSFSGDGSGLVGITSTQIDLFGGGPSENELVTVNSSGTGLDAESTLTYDGSIFTYTLNSGDTGAEGFKILSPANNGKLQLIIF